MANVIGICLIRSKICHNLCYCYFSLPMLCNFFNFIYFVDETGLLLQTFVSRQNQDKNQSAFQGVGFDHP